jgi:1-aminocyclopropane-1-carboxylate deaminase/D-cysteine desulfhydrase-like pyridoxal-dependent ACC family enzyme
VSLLRRHTPIEEYALKDMMVFVKRDDLVGIPPAPPLGKLRGLLMVLQRLHRNHVRAVGCWDTRFSKLGLGVAAAARQFPGMKAILGYPMLRGEELPSALRIAAQMGAELYPTPPNHTQICFFQTRKYVEKSGGTMLPFGLECHESVEAIAREASLLPERSIMEGTILLSCGSGVTLAGLLRGLPMLPRRLIGLSSGRSVPRIRQCLLRYVPSLPPCLELRPAEVPYEESVEIDCPFPSHPNYDRKAWSLLLREGNKWPRPILFWNIGS